MKRFVIIALGLISLLILACATRLVPVPAPDAIILPNGMSQTLEREGVVITVTSDAWRYDPIDVDYLFTPFHLTVENKTGTEIAIVKERIFMFDETKRQYGVVSPEEVDRAVTPRFNNSPFFFYGGHRYYRGPGDHDAWGWGFDAAFPINTYSSDVIPAAFHFGPIAPGAKVMGFIYLQELSPEAREATLEVQSFRPDGKVISHIFRFIRTE